MDLIIPIYKFDFLQNRDIYFLLSTSNKHLHLLKNSKYLNLALINIIKNNNIYKFKYLINNLDKSVFINKIIYKNKFNINTETTLITEILNLNRIELLDIIYNKFGFIGPNYYSIIFNNLHYLSFNIKNKFDLLIYLNKKNYLFESSNSNQINYNFNFWNYYNKKISYNLLPLHIISYFNDFNIINKYYNFIIKNNLQNLNDIDNFNMTCFLYSIKVQNFEYCKLLINNKCDIYCADIYKCNMFHYLCNTENSYENNKFFNKIWILVKNHKNIKNYLHQNNINNIKPIDYILKYGKYTVFKKIYDSNLIKCNYNYIEIVQNGYKYYFSNIYKSKNVEKTYQFNEYLKLIKLLLLNNVDFKISNTISKKNDPLHKVYKYIS